MSLNGPFQIGSTDMVMVVERRISIPSTEAIFMFIPCLYIGRECALVSLSLSLSLIHCFHSFCQHNTTHTPFTLLLLLPILILPILMLLLLLLLLLNNGRERHVNPPSFQIGHHKIIRHNTTPVLSN